jgi:hypothetical protein
MNDHEFISREAARHWLAGRAYAEMRAALLMHAAELSPGLRRHLVDIDRGLTDSLRELDALQGHAAVVAWLREKAATEKAVEGWRDVLRGQEGTRDE